MHGRASHGLWTPKGLNDPDTQPRLLSTRCARAAPTRTHPLFVSRAPRAGSLCINYIIKSAGALTLATVMTTRQLVSIVLSSIVFRSALTPAQWGAAAVVVSALYARGLTSKRAGKGGGGKGGAKTA